MPFDTAGGCAQSLPQLALHTPNSVNSNQAARITQSTAPPKKILDTALRPVSPCKNCLAHGILEMHIAQVLSFHQKKYYISSFSYPIIELRGWKMEIKKANSKFYSLE